MSEQQPGAHKEMSLLEHLGELRSCLLKSTIAVFVCAIAAYQYSTEVFELLSRPYYQNFSNNLLIGTGPAEALMLKLKVAFFVGVFISCPYIFYQVWNFIAPGLHEHERRYVLPFVLSSSGLFMLGAWFCYHFVLPIAFAFFHNEYVSIGITPAIQISQHISTVLQGLIAFGVVFELPILAFFLGRLGVIDHRFLVKYVRHAIVAIFIVAAIFSPPDVLSQFLLAIPLLALYCISILVVKVTGKKRSDETLPVTSTGSSTTD